MKYKTSPKLSRWVCAAHLTICLPKCDLVSLEAIWSGASLRSSGPSPAAAWFFVSLPVLPCAVQETNARLLVRLQCFDLHFQMEPEVPRHVEKTKPNFCNLQERCLRIIQIYFYMLFFFFFDRIVTSIKQKSINTRQKIRIADIYFFLILLTFSSPKDIDKASSDLSGRGFDS